MRSEQVKKIYPVFWILILALSFVGSFYLGYLQGGAGELQKLVTIPAGGMFLSRTVNGLWQRQPDNPNKFSLLIIPDPSEAVTINMFNPKYYSPAPTATESKPKEVK
jgi:hypothetical protein